MDNENLENIAENGEQVKAPENTGENTGASAASEMVATMTSNGVTKEELKNVLTELFAEKTDDIDTVVNKYILGLKGDGRGGEKA